MIEADFPHLSAPALVALSLIETPLLVFSLDARRAVWANGSAATFWEADSPGDLCRRLDARRNDAAAALLTECLQITQPGERRRVLWPLDSKPDGKDHILHCVGVRLDDHPRAVLVEFRQALSARENVTLQEQIVAAAWQTDAGDLRKVFLDLEAALRVERAVSRQQRRMLDIAAHEFRTPLAVIDGASQRLIRHAKSQSPERIVELAGRIREFVAKLESLLERTVERARQDVAEIECERQSGRIQHLIVKVASYFENRADVELAAEIAQLPPLRFDPILIEHVLVNLIENAVKYSDRRARIRISAKLTDECLDLSFRDWGIGIPLEDREKVFAENARGGNAFDRPGNGLGLFIVRAILRAHGGEVSVAETSGPGATIRLVLPLASEPPHGSYQCAEQD